MGIQIETVSLDITRERFVKPFGFKGSSFNEKWLCHVEATSTDGVTAAGCGGLAVLWSSPAVFAAHTETGGNVLMTAILDHALQLARGQTFGTPMDLLDAIFPATHAFACAITGEISLAPTFTLNALVGLDCAAWVLYARTYGLTSFDDWIPVDHRGGLANRQRKLACTPVIGYGLSIDEIRRLVTDGFFVLKIKIGASGDPETMLAKDMARLGQIHRAVSELRTPHTQDGKVRYYLDANGRYDGVERLRRLIGHAGELGMLDQTIILEEPFPEGLLAPVGDLGVTVAADESLHDPEDVALRAELGYGCLALKPQGKTLSVAIRMASEAHKRGLTCFVADNACVPALLDWNKVFAARLADFPGIGCGLIESNGHQNFQRWPELMAAHPCTGAPWLRM
ncbi:MAG: L-alanine-DL-glutamate epimerase, partial [Lentisphaerae bacterium]|nr:L-alanine-DL-glutamate epimerase [Lentisphaerota bacterium]